MDLTQSILKHDLKYDPETGLFTSIAFVPGRSIGSPCGFLRRNGYIDIKVRYRSYKAHRLAWLYVTGAWPIESIDHINGCRSDNRWINLRDVPIFINCQNRRSARRNSRSGLIGAHFDGQRQCWTSAISDRGKAVHLGTFATPQDAHEAYVAAKRVLHPGNTI